MTLHRAILLFFWPCLLLLAARALPPGVAQEPAGADLPRLTVLFDNDAPDEKQRTMRYGLILTQARDKNTPTGYKQLTYHPRGLTGNVCLKIDGRQSLLGEAPGQWLRREEGLGKDRLGLRSVWQTNTNVQVTQTVEIVRGALSGRYDTCRVQYRLQNNDEVPHTVGLRCLVDTFIGSNDGGPFVLPGRPELCTDEAEFDGPDKIPPFVLALERPELADPGVVAQLGLTPALGQEKPVRLTVGGWPDRRTGSAGAADGKTLWDVPLFSLRRMKDAAVTVYWAERRMLPGAVRDLGFTYGLGSYTGDQQGRLGLLLAGQPEVGRPLTLVALVRTPGEGTKVTLKLPDGCELAGGAATQAVPAPAEHAQGLSPVTWTLRFRQAGRFTLAVEADSGAALRREVEIHKGEG